MGIQFLFCRAERTEIDDDQRSCHRICVPAAAIVNMRLASSAVSGSPPTASHEKDVNAGLRGSFQYDVTWLKIDLSSGLFTFESATFGKFDIIFSAFFMLIERRLARSGGSSKFFMLIALFRLIMFLEYII